MPKGPQEPTHPTDDIGNDAIRRAMAVQVGWFLASEGIKFKLLTDIPEDQEPPAAAAPTQRNVPAAQIGSKERLNTAEAAIYTGLSASTLSKLRVFGGGPKHIKLGRRVVYDIRDLGAWMAARTRLSTSDKS